MIEETLDGLYRRHPEMKTRYGAGGRQPCREDIAYHFQVLTESMLAEDANIFLKYIGWGKSVLIHRKVKADDLLDCLLLMQEVVTTELGKGAGERASECIQLAIETFDSLAEEPPSCIDPSASLGNLANAYLEALLSSDRVQARKVIESAERTGVGFPEIYRHVFEPVQREVGRMWQVNQITVAQEHYCTANTEMLMSAMRAKAEDKPVDGHLFVGACVAGEQHSIGLRMVCETMEAQGWRTYFTGANTPTSSVVDLMKRLNVQVLGLSCATPMQLPSLRLTIAAVRASGKAARILVGGRIFGEFPGLWKKVGANGFAEDAASAVRVVGKLAGVKAGQPARL